MTRDLWLLDQVVRRMAEDDPLRRAALLVLLPRLVGGAVPANDGRDPRATTVSAAVALV